MAKKATENGKQQGEEAVANFEALLSKLYTLSRMNVRQFLGTREEGDPRVEYLTGLEAFKNMASVQLQILLGLVYAQFGDKKPEIVKMMEDEMGKQVQSMEEALAVTGWREDGAPILDLQAHLQKTAGWPQ